jgi:hypothetical protein
MTIHKARNCYKKLMELNFGFRITLDRGTPFAFRSQEEAMRKLITGLATLSALAAGLTMIGSRAEAAAIPSPGGLRAAIDTIALTETVQLYVFGGRRYCWYDDGWQGPGWYWCGYRWREGIGWGGGYGWHGWRGGHRGERGVIERRGGERGVIERRGGERGVIERRGGERGGMQGGSQVGGQKSGGDGKGGGGKGDGGRVTAEISDASLIGRSGS